MADQASLVVIVLVGITEGKAVNCTAIQSQPALAANFQ